MLNTHHSLHHRYLYRLNAHSKMKGHNNIWIHNFCTIWSLLFFIVLMEVICKNCILRWEACKYIWQLVFSAFGKLRKGSKKQIWTTFAKSHQRSRSGFFQKKFLHFYYFPIKLVFILKLFKVGLQKNDISALEVARFIN